MAPLLLFLPLLLENFLVLKGGPFFVIADIFVRRKMSTRKDGEVMGTVRVSNGADYRVHMVEFLDTDPCAVVRVRADEDGSFSMSIDVRGAMCWVKLSYDELVKVRACVNNALGEVF